MSIEAKSMSIEASNVVEIMKQALEALENVYFDRPEEHIKRIITSLRQAIEQAEKQEPVAWMRDDEMKAMVAIEKQAWIEAGRAELVEDYNKQLYTSPYVATPLPAQRPTECKPLTDEQIEALMDTYDVASIDYARAIEAAHGIKGGA